MMGGDPFKDDRLNQGTSNDQPAVPKNRINKFAFFTGHTLSFHNADVIFFAVCKKGGILNLKIIRVNLDYQIFRIT